MSDYGERVGKAFDAIRLFYSDISRLFRELDDREYSGWKSVFGDEVYKQGTKDLKSKCWMPAAVVRFYYQPGIDPSLVEGITAQFFIKDRSIPEPVLIASRIKYQCIPFADSKLNPKRVRDPWICWSTNAWNEGRWRFDEIPYRIDKSDKDSIEWAIVKGVPAYSIKSRDEVATIIANVRAINVDRGEANC